MHGGVVKKEETAKVILESLSRIVARYLQKEVRGYSPLSTTSYELLKTTIKPGDILLIEGSQRISVAIKYLTQSTWSHAAICVSANEPMLIEVDIIDGAIEVPLSKYAAHNTRICRPHRLTRHDLGSLLLYLKSRIGMTYDLKNAFDLLRYLLPQPPVPSRWKRRMLSLGSGDPTRAICSTLIAQAFQHINYPILPYITNDDTCPPEIDTCKSKEIMQIRHHSLFTPRDFDLSPYFKVIKPTLENKFNYKKISWLEVEKTAVTKSMKREKNE